ncbi:hypothetical protein DICPUDRAFT_85978 [Dictyostelium purpureum]|uniref:Threonyl/alanyl tRNA synthetase SAD domain-containing protein n=1 Tax=Dictyostelium purpureum TaxID=5786 RepID=F0Z8M8_DICPU|nr:uncharacterized protein DICPUDRAFT_85978 [Dictyostelium purpureum]EGC39660.1 hypothetical protein DICPUDRAFT_85978 [Dictyostelium purpureum]|eukprot:XP_003283769.1 hypothetical protein DICPUDRAFT_85978 [Dictyostelium purpureum]
MSKPRDSITDSACHVLKGAIVKILNTPLTISVDCTNSKKGRISVEYDQADKPTAEIIQQIEDEANKIIKENLEFKVCQINRKEAEEKYKSNLVNNTFIYDKFPVPESVTSLTLVELKDWNINCCPATHLKTTGEIGSIKIAGINHRANKKELEFRFDIGAPLAATTSKPSSTSSSSAKPATAAAAAPSHNLTLKDTDVQLLTKKIMQLVVEAKGDENKLSEAHTDIEQILTILKNTSYTNGYQSVIRK